jgi:hypothetical protein
LNHWPQPQESILQIACLHTADSNILVFDAAARELGLPSGLLRHEVRSDLLLAAEQSGGVTPTIEKETASALLVLSRSANVVLLTCSTLGPVAARLGGTSAVPILRVDAALAGQAVASVVLCAVETTVGPTTSLFEEVAEGSQAAFEFNWCRTHGAVSRSAISSDTSL